MQIGEPTNQANAQGDDWIAIRLLDSDGAPQAWQEFILATPSGDTISGKLNQKGYCRISGIAKGTYRVSFPDVPNADWSLVR